MDQGKYVPDSLVNDIIAERFRQADCPRSFLMDGYPRTLAQAIAFDAVLKQADLELTAVAMLEVPDDEIVTRISGRRSCPNCGAVYHLTFQPPQRAEICDQCGTALTQRSDDQEEIVRQRLAVYHQATANVLDFYKQLGLLHVVSGVGPVPEVFATLQQALKSEGDTR
jgi:adenylate kinase